MVNPIVRVNVSQIIAPTPNTLQKTGAFVSQGATDIGVNNTLLLTQLSDLTAHLNGALAITSLAWASSTVTVTTAAPHGITVGVEFPVVIAGATPSGYNGSFTGTSTGTSTFTYPLVSDPGSETVPGTYTLEDVSELLAMATTFFAQGGTQAIYVLELGPGDASDGVTALGTYITNNPGTFYSYLVPRYWDADSDFLAFLADYESTTAKTYFFVTTTTETYSSYTALMKCVFWMIEAPTIPATEFSCAAPFFVSLNYTPSSTNRVTPFGYSYLYGVTAYPTKGNASTITAIQAANGNIVGTGSEGGISNTILLWGTTADGNPFNYWYSVDWAQINVDLDVSNAVINGSNNPANPLYYNQAGIDRLQGVAASTMARGITYGLVLNQIYQTDYDQTVFDQMFDDGDFDGQTVVNAIPFVTYVKANPSDYGDGKYAGFTIEYTPIRGFTSITFNLVVSQFATA